MKRYLITGFSGFVSHHFLDFLERQDPDARVLGLDVSAPHFSVNEYRNIKIQFQCIDLLDRENLQKIIFDFQPDYVLHLASYSSVAFSWKNPVASFTNNTNIFLNLVEYIRELNLPCRILSIGSSEEYGRVTPDQVPLAEDHVLNPISPYAVARVSQEMLSKVYVQGFGMDIILTRSFNHIGPGQREIFVVSSFARQLADIKKNKKQPTLTTGNLAIVRDFLDVRDVVKAYFYLLRDGERGNIYNVCSNKGVSLQQILDLMAGMLDISVETYQDPNLIRPDDNPVIIGDNSKITQATQWRPEISLERSLEDLIEYWTNVV